MWGSHQDHPIGESEAGLDILEIGDLDGDGFNDVLALGQSDRLLRWFRRPLDPAAQSFPWDVFNIVQYSNLVPTAMEIADLDGNGQLDIVAAAGGHIRWFTPLGDSPFESWSEQFVVSDALLGDASDTVGSSPFFPINSVHAVDIDGDGRLDIVGTFDREGTDNDVIVWFQNTEVEIE
ncbi:MAG: VCBS repeat-containing protein [Planctomycetes bacterium]|nr:VCBS repeat-containing protein [Planctomycetota bacterium]